MLELWGAFTIGAFAGIGVSIYVVFTFIDKYERKMLQKRQAIEQTAKVINQAAKEIEQEQQEQIEIKQGSNVIINSIEGPSTLLPYHGQKAKIINADVVLYCQIEGIKNAVVVPYQCVVPDKK